MFKQNESIIGKYIPLHISKSNYYQLRELLQDIILNINVDGLYQLYYYPTLDEFYINKKMPLPHATIVLDYPTTEELLENDIDQLSEIILQKYTASYQYILKQYMENGQTIMYNKSILYHLNLSNINTIYLIKGLFIFQEKDELLYIFNQILKQSDLKKVFYNLLLHVDFLKMLNDIDLPFSLQELYFKTCISTIIKKDDIFQLTFISKESANDFLNISRNLGMTELNQIWNEGISLTNTLQDRIFNSIIYDDPLNVEKEHTKFNDDEIIVHDSDVYIAHKHDKELLYYQFGYTSEDNLGIFNKKSVQYSNKLRNDEYHGLIYKTLLVAGFNLMISIIALCIYLNIIKPFQNHLTIDYFGLILFLIIIIIYAITNIVLYIKDNFNLFKYYHGCSLLLKDYKNHFQNNLFQKYVEKHLKRDHKYINGDNQSFFFNTYKKKLPNIFSYFYSKYNEEQK